MLLVIAALFIVAVFVPHTVRWSLVGLAVVLAPYALLPFAFKLWLRRDAQIPADRWVAVTILSLLLLAATFFPARFFERYFSPFRGLSFWGERYVSLAAWLLLLIVLLFTAYAIVRRYRGNKR